MGKIDLIDAQAAFEQFRHVGDKTGYGKMKCPTNCKGRIQNKGNCTPENCIMMHRKPVAISALKIAAGKKKPRVRKLSKRDRALLRKIKPEYYFRAEFRPKVLKPQLEANGGKMARLNPGKVRPPTWSQIFEQYKKAKGKELKEEVQAVWRKLGKGWAVRNVNTLSS